ncbi:MAG TPA: rod shape-determining protein MreC [Steroidobacteraceae bacterium]|nr:rod shape-determining protein MreC [Steroidobacteraceae bacterium]
MAAYGLGATNRRLTGHGSSPGLRFTLYAFVSIVVMVLDQRGGWLTEARFLLQAAAYPLQLAVSSPSAAWAWIKESTQAREALRAENERLRARESALALRALNYEGLARENAQLRGLAHALPPIVDRWLIGEIVNVELTTLRQRLLINRGTTNGVFAGQAVLDDSGLLGQTIHIGPWSAEVILVTDPEHAVPVQIERTGLRTIAVGAGNEGTLALPYLPANADVKAGDLLVTSGLGGVFPAGYPVARVAEVHRDAIQPLAQVRAVPLARIDRDREVALVWFNDERTKNPDIQAQPAPHPSVPAGAAPAAPAPASAAASAVPAKAAAAPAKSKTSPAPKSAPKPAPEDQAEDEVQ